MHNQLKKMDTKELQLPETTFTRDIESKVFQGIVLQCLMHIENVSLVEGNLIDNLFGREASERVSGIHIEQDLKTHSVSVKVEVNVEYGTEIPQKAEEIQRQIAKEISRLCGLHVKCVHVVFKNLMTKTSLEEQVVASIQQEEYGEEL